MTKMTTWKKHSNNKLFQDFIRHENNLNNKRYFYKIEY